MGGEPLLRPQFVHKVVNYAAKKGFWIYIATNGRFCVPKWQIVWGTRALPSSISRSIRGTRNLVCQRHSCRSRKHLEHLLKKQYVYGYMVFFNMNICRNNTQDIRQLTEYAREHRIATDYHINETPMLEQDDISNISATIQPTFVPRIGQRSIRWWTG